MSDRNQPEREHEDVALPTKRWSGYRGYVASFFVRMTLVVAAFVFLMIVFSTLEQMGESVLSYGETEIHREFGGQGVYVPGEEMELFGPYGSRTEDLRSMTWLTLIRRRIYYSLHGIFLVTTRCALQMVAGIETFLWPAGAVLRNLVILDSNGNGRRIGGGVSSWVQAPGIHFKYIKTTDNDLLEKRMVVIPAIYKLGLFQRKSKPPRVEKIREEDLANHMVSGRSIESIFSVMQTIQTVTKRTCMAMHHFEGYEGNPRDLVGILVEDGRQFIRAVNVSIVGHSPTIAKFGYTSTMCPSKRIDISRRNYKAGVYINYVRYDKPSPEYVLLTDMESTVENERYGNSTTTVVHNHWIFGKTALCLQILVDEVNGYDPCEENEPKKIIKDSPKNKTRTEPQKGK